MFLNQFLKQFLAILACCYVPIMTYFVSTIIVHAQLANELKDLDSDDKNEALAIYFTSSYLTIPLFAVFFLLIIVKDLKPNMKIFFVIFLPILDGALTVTTAGGVSMAQYLIVYRGAGISMFVGAALFLLVKFFPILPIMFQYVTKGLIFTPYMEGLLKTCLPIVIFAGLAVGFIFSLMYAGAAIALVAVLYSTDYDESLYNSFISREMFMLSLPALVYFLMIVAMISYVLFKWKWGVRYFSVLAFFLLALLGYSLNVYIGQLYTVDNFSQTLEDEVEALHRANISLTTASFGMVLTTIFLNICWPILYNVQHENKESAGLNAVEENYEESNVDQGQKSM